MQLDNNYLQENNQLKDQQTADKVLNYSLI